MSQNFLAMMGGVQEQEGAQKVQPARVRTTACTAIQPGSCKTPPLVPAPAGLTQAIHHDEA